MIKPSTIKCFFVIVCFAVSLHIHAQTTDTTIIEAAVTDSTNTLFNQEALRPFYEKLNQLAQKRKKQVRILHLGDSHIQMGYFVGEIRNTLESFFGLSAVGMLFPSPIAHYKPFYIGLKGVEGKWQGSNYLSPEGNVKYGVSGFTIQTSSPYAKLELWPKNIPGLTAHANKVTLYYSGEESCTISLSGIHTKKDTGRILASVQVEEVAGIAQHNEWKKLQFYFEEEVDRFILTVAQKNISATFKLYGLQLLQTEQPGIVYHNAGVGGSTFLNLCNNASLSLSQIQDMDPDLIIFSYGSNEGYTSSFDAQIYNSSIQNYISRIKKTIPNASLLFTAPPDSRSKNRFPRNIDSIIYVLKKIAIEEGAGFWDLHKQMGGNGSVIKWLETGLASTDKLHFTREGYELQGKLFCEALLQGYNKYVPEKEQLTLPRIQKR